MASNAKGARYTCVIELEFDIELFLVKGWKRPADYIYWNSFGVETDPCIRSIHLLLRIERDPWITFELLVVGLKQTQ